MIPTTYFESWEEYKKKNKTEPQDDAIVGKQWDDLNKELFLLIMLNTF
ncbi:MAG: hypothetical protein RR614_07355 [Eubacterium sp.]